MNYQKIKTYAFITSLFFLGSCKKIDKLTQFTIPYDESVTIKSTTGIGLPFDILTPDISTNSESTFALNNTRADLVQQIKLTKLTLTITSPSGGDFSFLKSIAIYISASGQPETKVAWNDSIPANPGKTIELQTTDTDLKNYIKQSSFTLRLNTVTDKLLTSDYKIDIHAEFFVDAKILGV